MANDNQIGWNSDDSDEESRARGRRDAQGTITFFEITADSEEEWRQDLLELAARRDELHAEGAVSQARYLDGYLSAWD